MTRPALIRVNDLADDLELLNRKSDQNIFINAFNFSDDFRERRVGICFCGHYFSLFENLQNLATQYGTILVDILSFTAFQRIIIPGHAENGVEDKECIDPKSQKNLVAS